MNAGEVRPLQGTCILVAEDNALVAYDTVRVLREVGASILGPAMTLAQAVGLAKAGNMDCGVLDVRFRDGLISPAADILWQKGIGIVFYTGESDFERLELGWPGARVLCKPAPPRLLVQAVVALCGPERQLMNCPKGGPSE